MQDDKNLIDSLGGITKVAALLCVSTQRVCNWKRRGIPSRIKVEFPHLFLKQHHEAIHE